MLEHLEKPLGSYVYSNVLALRTTLIFVLLLVSGATADLSAQFYVGAGFHLTPPIHLDHSRTPYAVVLPRPGIGGSISFQKEWGLKRDRKWYLESGITLQGLRYRKIDYYGDSVAIWSDFVNQHTGFPCLLAGVGYSFPVGKSKGRLSIGGDVSLLFSQDLGGIFSYSFGIVNDPLRDAVFPVFARLNLAYGHDFNLFRTVSAHWKLYTNISFQNITKGGLYIRNKPTGLYREGGYRVNNSELGIKVFASLSREVDKKRTKATTDGNNAVGESKKKQKVIISLNGQLFTGNNIQYYIPQIDSFSISNRPILLRQIGMTAELPLGKGNLWSGVFGLGIGERSGTLEFRSDGNFPSHKQPINFGQSIDIGHYGILNVGLSRKHDVRRLQLLHTLTACVVMPLEKELTYLGIPLFVDNNQPYPYENAILEGWFDYTNGREKVVWGVEYNPELIFNFRAPFFIGLGLIANHSFGGRAIAHGTYKVYNEYTTYYGAALQRFSKLGVSFRVGFAK